MPRFYNWYRDGNGETSGGGDPIDLCRRCWGKSLANSIKINRLDNGLSDLNEQRANGGEDHPPYSECDYECYICGKGLTNKDD